MRYERKEKYLGDLLTFIAEKKKEKRYIQQDVIDNNRHRCCTELIFGPPATLGQHSVKQIMELMNNKNVKPSSPIEFPAFAKIVPP